MNLCDSKQLMIKHKHNVLQKYRLKKIQENNPHAPTSKTFKPKAPGRGGRKTSKMTRSDSGIVRLLLAHPPPSLPLIRLLSTDSSGRIFPNPYGIGGYAKATRRHNESLIRRMSHWRQNPQVHGTSTTKSWAWEFVGTCTHLRPRISLFQIVQGPPRRLRLSCPLSSCVRSCVDLRSFRGVRPHHVVSKNFVNKKYIPQPKNPLPTFTHRQYCYRHLLRVPINER